jgi:putative tricarboxylic transport membrane protein
MSAPGAQTSKGRPHGAAFAIAAGLAALGGLLIWQGMIIPDKGGYAGIGSGAAPKAIGAGLILLALGHLYTGAKTAPLPTEHQNWRAIGWILAGLLAQLILLKPFGFTVASGILFACTAHAMGYPRGAVALGVGLVLALAVYGIFDGLLKLNLPADWIEHIIYGG